MFRRGRFQAGLSNLVANDQLCTHPFVVAELACGTLPSRKRTLTYLDLLISLPIVRLDHVRMMIEARGLWGKGIGLTDAQLTASCLATPGTQLWTIDAPLGRVADSLGIRANLP